MNKKKISLVILSITFVFLFAFSPLASVSTSATSANNVTSKPTVAPSVGAFSRDLLKAKTTCTDCWTGYSISSMTNGTFTSVQTNKTVPTISCPASLVNQYGLAISAWGVVSDGYAGDFTGNIVAVECYNTNGNNTATSYWFYEWFTENSTYFGAGGFAFTPNPGDSMFLAISASANTFTFTDNDYTLGCPTNCVTATNLVPEGLALNLTGCISDMFTGSSLGNGAFPSVTWKTASFTNCKVDGPSLSPTPIGGVKSKTDTLTTWTAIGQYANKKGKYPTLAKPTKLVSKDSFGITWESNGP